MALVDTLNFKGCGSVMSSNVKKNVDLNYSNAEPSDFLKHMFGEREDCDISTTTSKLLKNSNTLITKEQSHEDRCDCEDSDDIAGLVAEKVALMERSNRSTHASDMLGDKSKLVDVKDHQNIPCGIFVPNNLITPDNETEVEDGFERTKGSKNIGNACLVHGGTVDIVGDEVAKPPVNVVNRWVDDAVTYSKQEGVQDILESRSLVPIRMRKPITDTHCDNEMIDVNRFSLLNHRIGIRDTGVASTPILNSQVQKFITDGFPVESNTLVLEKSRTESLIPDHYDGLSGADYISNQVSDTHHAVGVDISRFKSLLVDKIQTAREIGEIKMEMTVNIRPSVMGDISITISNGLDGCVVSLVAASQSATNYLSLIKKGLEKTTGAKINIGVNAVDRKGNISLIDFKNEKFLKHQKKQ